jgi:predicted ATPase
MNWLEHLTLREGPFLKRVAKADLSFKPGINLLVGPNGSGKSTILKLLRRRHPEVTYTFHGRIETRAFDFEKDNPRGKGSLGRDNDSFHLGLAMMLSSHGEAVKAILSYLKNPEVEGLLLLLDEPEQALDLTGLQELVEILKTTPAHQAIVVTHSPFLMLQPGFNVVEMEDGYRYRVRKGLKDLINLQA